MVRTPNRIQSAPMRRRPMSPIVPLVIILVLVVGALFFFSHHAKVLPTAPVEVDVAATPAAK